MLPVLDVDLRLRTCRLDDQDFLVTVDDAMRNVAVNDAIMRSLQSNALEVVETIGS